MSAQHTQEPVAKVDMSDEGQWADILPDRDVKLGQLLYAFPPDAAARIAELERTLRQQAEAVTATINRHHQQMAELEKQCDTLLAACEEALEAGSDGDWQSAERALTSAIASVKEQA